MAISVADNFSYLGSKPLDGRLQYPSIAAMTSASASGLYDGILAYVTAEKKYYTYDSTNDTDQTLGKWREYSSGGTDPDLEGRVKTLEEDMYGYPNFINWENASVSGGITSNGDGTFSANEFTWSPTTNETCAIDTVSLPAGTYRLVGCPSTAVKSWLEIDGTNYKDTGSGVTFNLDSASTVTVNITIDRSKQYMIGSTKLFKPMLTTKIDTTYDDFVAYPSDPGAIGRIDSNADYTSKVEEDVYDNILGIKNLLIESSLHTPGTIISSSNLTWEYAENRTFKLLSGTVPSGTGGESLSIIQGGQNSEAHRFFKRYRGRKLSLRMAQNYPDIYLRVEFGQDFFDTKLKGDSAQEVIFTVPEDLPQYVYLRIKVKEGVTANNQLIAPMITLADSETPITLYREPQDLMTVKELTEAVSKELTDEDLDEIVDELPTSLIEGINYSTTEQVIGQWIDGKPLYQKTIVVNNVTVPSNDKVNVGSTSGLNIDYGMVVNTTGVEVGGDYIEGTGYVSAWLRKPDNNFGVRCTFTETQYEKLYITLQYTKTTD